MGARPSLSTPFAAERIEVISELSARLLADRRIIERPALAYFAHWTRRGAIRNLAAQYARTAPPQTISAPRGTVLHIPPRNVETIFLFSWTSSFMVGNANVIRLPSDSSGPVMDTLDLLIELTSKIGVTDIFLSYPVDEEVNAALSRSSDVRIVWGGDAKVAAFEKLPLRHGGKAIWFGDRYSYAVASGKALASASMDALADLARRLETDIFTFDQMGCSSPHKLYVVGNTDDHGASVMALIDAVRSEANRRGVKIPPAHTVRKLTEAFALAGSESRARIPARSAELMSIFLPRLRRVEDRVGGGYIVVEFIAGLEELLDIIRAPHQTLTHYGFAIDELAAFARKATLAGLSRIVPAGQALNFDVIWDGYDLLRELTRTVRLG